MARHILSLLVLLSVSKSLTTPLPEDTTGMLQVLTSQYPGQTTPRPGTGDQKPVTESGPTSPLFNLLGSTPVAWKTPAATVSAGQFAVESTNPWLYWSTRPQDNPSPPYYDSTFPYWPTGAKNSPSAPYYGSTYPYWPTGAKSAKSNPSTPYYGSTYPYWPTGAKSDPSAPYYGSTYPYWSTGGKSDPSAPYYGSTYPYWPTGATNNPSYPYQPTGSGNEQTTHAYPQTTSNPYSTPSGAWIQPSTVRDPFYYYTTYPYWLTGIHSSPTPASYVTGYPNWETSRQYSSLGDTSEYPQTPLYDTGNPQVTTQPAFVPTSAPGTLATLYDTWETTHPQFAGLLHLTVSTLAGDGDSPTINCTLDALPRNTVGIVSLVISKYSGQPVPRYTEVASINIFHPDSPKLGRDFQSAAVKGVLNNDNGTFYLSVQSSLAAVADARWYVCVAGVLDEFGVSQDIKTSATI
ncbi:unnamed protein product [Lymnaea stagnalis]|uniref:Uncharacterized protein n=1 Tax=Lymnaea stagnalis TaxID=6523 RepID=A0AAV2IE65_LYMST